MLRSGLVVVLVGFFVGRSQEGVTKGSAIRSKSDGDSGSGVDSGTATWTKSGGDNGSALWAKSGGDSGSAAWSKYGGKGGSATWPKSGGADGFSAWPKEPELVNDYEAKGQLIELDATMQAYKIGSGSKMIVWGHDIFGLTGEKSDNGRTKEWADFLAENGYNVLIPDWYRGNNLPGGTFGPSTPAWSASVTNWTKIEIDWTNVILPYIQKESPSSIGMIGTCWGSYPVVRLSMFDTISAGVSMHPSHPILMATAGDDEAEVLGLIKSPQLFLVEGEAVESVKTGGLSQEVLGDKLTVVEFPDMKHGWTVRGNLEDPDVARDVKKAKELVLEFFGKNLKSDGVSGSTTWRKSGGDAGSAAWSKYGGKAGSADWPKSGGDGGFSAWPKEPELVNDYEAKGQLIELDATMQAYKIGSGSKMVVWGHDIFGLTGEKSDNGRTKEWADFLAENGYNVLVPDWYRGNNLPGGTFGPSTPAWSASVTNWTKIESDWTNVILPYLQKESPSSIGMIGTCWGSYPVVRLSMFDTISAGVSMHPSHPILMGTAGDDEAEVLGLIESPQLFLVEGGAVDSVKTGGLSQEVLGDKLTVVEFPDMKHGWTVRGNLEDPDVARDVEKAKELVLDFFGNNLK